MRNTRKRSAEGVAGKVFRQLVKPLEELAAHADVKSIHTNESFGNVGRRRGFRTGLYSNYALRVTYQGPEGGQVLKIYCDRAAVSRVEQEVQRLQQKYGRKLQ